MMQVFFSFCLWALVCLIMPATVIAQDCQTTTSAEHQKPGSGFSCITGGVENMVIEHSYAYPTAEIQKNGAVFMTIKNTGDKVLRIIGANSDIAEKIELHTTNMDGDVMMMREVEHYEIPAHSDVNLEPMGHHIMLLGLKKQLKKGEGFVLNLDIEDGQHYVLNVRIGQKDL